MSPTLTITILVVEDTPSERELMSHYLHSGGYAVISTDNAKDGLEKAIDYQPDVIITDIVMPGMSGFELCRSLRKHPLTATVPIIICTSKDQGIDRLWGMKQGANAYITKPFTREHLICAVQSAVQSIPG